jgi:hypothetical protein
MRPTADQIARAIVAASRECGVDPLAVARGDMDRQHGQFVGYMTGRARHYAAEALRRQFKNVPMTEIAMWCGVRNRSSIKAYFSAKDQARASGKLVWWDEAVVVRVIEAIGTDSIDTAPRQSSPHFYYEPVRAVRREPEPAAVVIDEMTGKRRLSAVGSGFVTAGLPAPRRDEFLRQAVENTARMQESGDEHG